MDSIHLTIFKKRVIIIYPDIIFNCDETEVTIVSEPRKGFRKNGLKRVGQA